jgi:hypothetical protein
MVGSSKILTVTYGTFSCTLEGFDDSFGTMKAIAEYFRDLAADDRYFGAVPPVPDAEMLSRIAEREVARRVEARLEGGAIMLRTGQALAQHPAPSGPADPVLTAPAPLAEQPKPAPVMPPQITPVPRQVNARVDPAPTENAAPMDMTAATVITPSQAAPAQMSASAVPVSPEPAEPSTGSAGEPFSLPAHPDADSVAAKLQRIRAVVGRGVTPFAPQDYAEDQGDGSAVTMPEGEAIPDQSLAASWNDLVDQADLPLPDVPSEQSVSKAEAEAEAEVEPQIAAPVVKARVIRVRRASPAISGADQSAVDAIPQMDGVDRTVAGQTSAPSDDLPDLDALSDLMALDGVQDENNSAGDAAALLAASEEFDLAPLSVDDTPAIALESPEDVDPGYGSLAPDAEADLMQELAAVEREADLGVAEDNTGDNPFSMASVMEAAALPPMGTDDIAVLLDSPAGDDEVFDFSALSDPDATPIEADEGTSSSTVLRLGRDLLDREPEADEEAMNRILSQTDAELNAPENSRRRAAIAQLKAAVAATEAARLLGETTEDTDTDEVENAFRDDLKQVVRPRRPIGEVSPEQRSERPRPAPLKLVASQRIDIPPPRPAPKPIMPVRPRRVSVQDETVNPGTTPGTATSFAEFAASMGAVQLPDLLEAAAAYTSYVEGVEDFSRPQLMKKVQDMSTQDFSREDGLRSFGTLLRQGRIMKTANGRFVVNEETRFKPERKTA